MDSYSFVKTGKLKLKNNKHKKKSHSSKRSSKPSKSTQSSDARVKDAEAHGGWWGVSTFAEVFDTVAIQLNSWSTPSLPESAEIKSDSVLPSVPPTVRYLSATDEGLFTVGPPRGLGEPPAPEEIFIAMKVSDAKVSLKTGYGKYLGVSTDSNALLLAIADAIGPREHFEPVFQDGKTAILGANNCFLSADPNSGDVAFVSPQARDEEMVTIRSNRPVLHDPLMDLPEEERQGLDKAELNYVRKFQSWQDHKLRLSKDEKSSLKQAKQAGVLHECLLDRREKMKSDRYCK